MSPRRRGELCAVLAALAWSSAGIIQRQLALSAPAQIAGRSLFACAALACYLAVRRRAAIADALRPSTVAVATLMAVANASFILALNHATVAHVLVFQALSPLVAALMGAWLLGEKLTGATYAASAAAVAGVALMVGGPGGGSALGNGLGALTAIAFALMIVIARHQRGGTTLAGIWLSQVILIIAFGGFLDPSRVSLGAWGWLGLLGIGQLALGAVLFAVAAQYVPANDLALILLLEIVLGAFWTWIGVGEQPSERSLLGGMIVVAAVATQVGVRSGDRDTSTVPGLQSQPAREFSRTPDRAALCDDGTEPRCSEAGG
jgi:drug/metabolite transporter (DMT)-like permease